MKITLCFSSSEEVQLREVLLLPLDIVVQIDDDDDFDSLNAVASTSELSNDKILTSLFSIKVSLKYDDVQFLWT